MSQRKHDFGHKDAWLIFTVDIPAVFLHFQIDALQPMTMIAALVRNVFLIQLAYDFRSGIAEGNVKLLLEHTDIQTDETTGFFEFSGRAGTLYT